MTIHHHTKYCVKHTDCRSIVPISYIAGVHKFPLSELADALRHSCHLVRLSCGDVAICTQCADDFNRIIGLATMDFSNA